MTPVRSLLAGLLLVAGVSSAQLVATHRSSSGSGNVTEMKPDIKIKNTGSSSVDLSKITIDYLFYENGISAGSLVPACYYVSPSQCPDMSIDIASIPLQTNGSKSANFRARIAFASGSLAAGQELSMQWGIHGQGWTHFFNESDDWSYTSNNGQWNPAPGIVVANPGPPGMTLPMTWNGTMASLPTTAANGVVVRNSTADAVSVFDGTSWALVAQGTAGAKGPTGDPGPQGDQGLAGLVGPDGTNGPVGPSGATGPVGAQGIQGLPGNQGIQGPLANLTTQSAKLASLKATVEALRPKLSSPVVSVVANSYYSLVLKQDGSVWGSGDNRAFEGGSAPNRNTPFLSMTGVTAISPTTFLKPDGTLWQIVPSAAPVKVMDNVKSAVTGGAFILILKTDGTLWAQGSNSDGQFGNGTIISSSIPVQVNSDVASMGAGLNFSLVVKTNGDLYTCGSNARGQLGDGTAADKLTPVRVATGVISAVGGFSHSAFLKADGSVWGMGATAQGELGTDPAVDLHSPALIASGVQSIAVGFHSLTTLILLRNGTLLGTGANQSGQLGDGTTNDALTFKTIATGVKSMSNSMFTTIYLKTDGSVWGAGRNLEGQFGNGTNTSSLVPVKLNF